MIHSSNRWIGCDGQTRIKGTCPRGPQTNIWRGIFYDEICLVEHIFTINPGLTTGRMTWHFAVSRRLIIGHLRRVHALCDYFFWGRVKVTGYILSIHCYQLSLDELNNRITTDIYDAATIIRNRFYYIGYRCCSCDRYMGKPLKIYNHLISNESFEKKP